MKVGRPEFKLGEGGVCGQERAWGSPGRESPAWRGCFFFCLNFVLIDWLTTAGGCLASLDWFWYRSLKRLGALPLFDFWAAIWHLLDESCKSLLSFSQEADQLKLVLKRELDRMEAELRTKDAIISDYKNITQILQVFHKSLAAGHVWTQYLFS